MTQLIETEVPRQVTAYENPTGLGVNDRPLRLGVCRRQRSKKADIGAWNAQRVERAFGLAAREQAELARLRASGRPFACLDFVGASGYANDYPTDRT